MPHFIKRIETDNGLLSIAFRNRICKQDIDVLKEELKFIHEEIKKSDLKFQTDELILINAQHLYSYHFLIPSP
jgi:hypothetical protein